MKAKKKDWSSHYLYAACFKYLKLMKVPEKPGQMKWRGE